jgi:hypothetical protein
LANEPARGASPPTSWWRGLSRKDAAIIACGALAAVAAVVLLALPALWYTGGVGAGFARPQDIVADLAELSALDARWEREALRALNDFAPTPAVDSAAALAGVTKRLEAVARGTGSPVLQRSLPDVVRAFTEKAELVGRFEQAHGASRNALREALAMEAELTGLLREAWRDAPDRQRLVAADNVVTQLLADVQRYYFVPADSIRKNLEASTADLRSAAEALPSTLKPAAARLERHVADLLRARPQEQTYFDRVRFHNAGPRAATLTRELRRELDQNQFQRDRYRVHLAAYFCALLVLMAYLVARLIRRELALRGNSTHATSAVGKEGLSVEPTLPPPPDAAPGP